MLQAKEHNTRRMLSDRLFVYSHASTPHLALTLH